MKTTLLWRSGEQLLRNYAKHLLSTQGLAAGTCEGRVVHVREFLRAQCKAGRGAFRLRKLTPEVLLGYVLKRSRRVSPRRLQVAASALRSFCRYLRFRGLVGCDLTSALPRIASRGPQSLPDYLRPEQLEALLGSIDIRSLAGRRNYALILCMARLGLRAGEAGALRLEQIDWRAGVLRLSAGKGRRERELPLPKDVGRAIAQYLRGRSAGVGCRQVFCTLHQGGSLRTTTISKMVRRALKRAGISTSHQGAHLLRHTIVPLNWSSRGSASRRWPIFWAIAAWTRLGYTPA